MEKKEMTMARLKAVAYITMFIDHLAFTLVDPYLKSLGYESDNYISLAMTLIGRIAFPLFCFMLIEGIKKSHNKEKYLLRLLIMAIVSEPCFDLAHSGSLWDSSYQNVCVLLFIGGCMLYLRDLIWNKLENSYLRWGLYIIVIGIAVTLTYLLKTDYSISGIFIILAIELALPYVKTNISASVLIMAAGIYLAYFIKYFTIYPRHREAGIDWLWYLNHSFTLQMFEPVSLFLLINYEGKKGKTLHKLFYYAFYPVHLLILGIIAKLVFNS